MNDNEIKFKKMENIFEKVYETKLWKTNNIKSYSGKGSERKNCIKFINFLNNFIEKNKIKTVYDFGCGDCEGVSDLNFDNIEYTGSDISIKALDLAKNKLKEKNNIKLIKNNSLNIEGKYDLLIVKHVLGHWIDGKKNYNGLNKMNCDAEDLITLFLQNNITKFKYIIINDSIKDIISEKFPKEFKCDKLKFNSFDNRFHMIYIYPSNNYKI